MQIFEDKIRFYFKKNNKSGKDKFKMLFKIKTWVFLAKLYFFEVMRNFDILKF